MFKKVLLPTDGSPLATQAATQGIEFAKAIGAEIVSIYVAVKSPVFSFDTKGDSPTKSEMDAMVKAAADKAFAPVREAAKAAGMALTERSCAAVSASGSIVAVAKDSGCDLIYMASRGNSGWDKVFMGSVAAKVLAESPIPVLIYKVGERELPKNYWAYSTEL